MCAYWPVPPQSQPHPVHYAGTPPILVVGTIHDPATPYPSAAVDDYLSQAAIPATGTVCQPDVRSTS
jgi:hypothetical protein